MATRRLSGYGGLLALSNVVRRIRNNAKRIDDLRIPPNNRLEPLQGDRKGQWSIRINDQWRVCFIWDMGHTKRIEICDYH